MWPNFLQILESFAIISNKISHKRVFLNFFLIVEFLKTKVYENVT